MVPCTVVPPLKDRLFAYRTTNRPAIRNQYGEMKTGIPNGRAITIPVWRSRWGVGRSGVMPATLTMLRDGRLARGVWRGLMPTESGKAARLSVAYLTLPLVGYPRSAPPTEAADSAHRATAGFAEARDADPGGRPPGPPEVMAAPSPPGTAAEPAHRATAGFAETRDADPGGRPPGPPEVMAAPSPPGTAAEPAHRATAGFAETRDADQRGRPPGPPEVMAATSPPGTAAEPAHRATAGFAETRDADQRGRPPGRSDVVAAPSPSGVAGPPAAELDVALVPGDGQPRLPAISPSRAGDFMTCPLLYRFRVIDRLPEPPSLAAVRGTLVHAVLERLFDRPAAERTPQVAHSLLDPEWDRLVAESPELAGLFDDEPGRVAWTAEVTSMLDRYFTMEDPSLIEPAERELYVETTLESGLRLRGYVDRLDIARGGAVRIVDYKTGMAPREEFEARALFQMKFYALVIWRLRGEVPRLLQLMYLGNGEILRYQPDEADLRATERKIQALWQAIERAMESGDWRARPSRICDWCAHKPICPEYGGTPPPLPLIPVPAVLPGRRIPPAAEPDATTPSATEPDAAAPSAAEPTAAATTPPAAEPDATTLPTAATP